jgi:kynurenine formamidase
MIFTESLTGLGQLPPTGAFYCVLGPKHADGPYGEGRALAILPGQLADRLIAAGRKKQAMDVSVVLSRDLPLTWTGRGIGQHRHPYTKADFLYAKNLGLYHHLHMLDSHTGTHLVPPSYALPASEEQVAPYAAAEAAWLEDFEKEFGPRGFSNVTTEQVPLAQTCGPARIIDVTALVGTTPQSDWPASPQISLAFVQQYEQDHGALQPGEIVIFRSGHSDRYFKPKPEGQACIADPLNGKSEGWPAPAPAAIEYLAQKGIRCVATDGPSLGGVDPRSALMTYWAMGRNNIVGVEFLTNLADVPGGAYFLFAPVKIEGCHGGPGRAIVLY